MHNLIFWKKSKINLNILYSMAFFLAVAGALPTYIQSSYLGNFFNLSAVTWFFVIANLISILAILIFPNIIRRLGNYLTTKFISLLFLSSFLGLGLSSNYFLIFLFFIMMQVALNLIWINMDIFIENSSKNSSTGVTRSVYFTAINLAWVVSPSLAAWLVSLNGYSAVYLASAATIIPFLMIFMFYGRKIKGKFLYKGISLEKTLKRMYRDKNLRGIFWLAMLLNVFFNAATVFIPIYLNRVIGFSWTELGLIFSLMIIPFILVEIPAGFIADKYLGEKEMLYLGYGIMIICLCLFFISTSTSLLFWAILLFISRIGAALVEAMRESYFFKKVDAKDIDKINIFRTSIPVGFLFGSLLSLIVLMFLPIHFIFLVTALVLCSAFPFLAIIHDTK